MVKKCLSHMSWKLSRTILRRRKGSNPFSLVEYICGNYFEALNTIMPSYSQKASPWQNACIKSFHALIKREWLYCFKIKNFGHAYKLVFEYIETCKTIVTVDSYRQKSMKVIIMLS